MGVARKLEELICWQLGDELRMRVLAEISKPGVGQDVEFYDQIRRSSRGVPALIAEGFGRQGHQEFVRYLRLALGELNETKNHLRDGAQSGHIAVDSFRELWRLCYRIHRACTSLINVLLRRIAEEKRAKPPTPSHRPRRGT
jgi:four helix bundle protein